MLKQTLTRGQGFALWGKTSSLNLGKLNKNHVHQDATLFICSGSGTMLKQFYPEIANITNFLSYLHNLILQFVQPREYLKKQRHF